MICCGSWNVSQDKRSRGALPEEPLLTLDAEEETERFSDWFENLSYHQRIGMRPLKKI